MWRLCVQWCSKPAVEGLRTVGTATHWLSGNCLLRLTLYGCKPYGALVHPWVVGAHGPGLCLGLQLFTVPSGVRAVSRRAETP